MKHILWTGMLIPAALSSMTRIQTMQKISEEDLVEQQQKKQKFIGDDTGTFAMATDPTFAERRVALIKSLQQFMATNQYLPAAEAAIALSRIEVTDREGARNLVVTTKALFDKQAIEATECCLLALAEHPGTDAELRNITSKMKQQTEKNKAPTDGCKIG